MNGHRANAVLIVALTVLVAGCGKLPGQDVGRTSGVGVDNRTSERLVLKIFSHGDWHSAGGVDAHQTELAIAASEMMEPDGLKGSNGCTDADLVAYTVGGVEVARHAPPLCVGDNWVIEAPTATPAVSPSTN